MPAARFELYNMFIYLFSKEFSFCFSLPLYPAVKDSLWELKWFRVLGSGLHSILWHSWGYLLLLILITFARPRAMR